MKYEVVELTEAQAREMAKACKRAKKMYGERWEADTISDSIRILKGGCEDVRDGKSEDLPLSYGMKGDTREELANILSLEVKMAKRKKREGLSDGRKINALERAVDSLKNPEEVEKDEYKANH